MTRKEGCFVLGDSTRCTGCRACVLACFDAHRNCAQGRTVGTVELPVDGRLYIVEAEGRRVPVQCRHCENAPCLSSCTVGAITRVGDAIVLNSEKCIGCKNCITACPFGAIEAVSMSDSESVVSLVKCDRCIDRGTPACVFACPNQALRLVKPYEDAEKKRILAAQSMIMP